MSMTAIYTNHPVWPLVFRHVQHPRFDYSVDFVGVGLLTERIDELKVEREMSSR